MLKSTLTVQNLPEKLLLSFSGELLLYEISKHQIDIDALNIYSKKVIIDLNNLSSIDTAGAIFIAKLQRKFLLQNVDMDLVSQNTQVNATLDLVSKYKISSSKISKTKTINCLASIGKFFYNYYVGLLSFMAFLGRLFLSKLDMLKSFKNVRFREIAFEINESAIKALGIVALTSFLIGVVVAYQSAYQLKIYGANIFIVDMLGISILRELSPLITAIVIAGRSGSAFTAQIGAMKITQELDAMETMGFDPYKFLVMPRIIALMITMPILIFISDIMAIFGGMLVSNLDLGITTHLFLERFNEVVAAKHLFIGLIKGPFFAFLIATIGVYRGLQVKDNTQSIGFNTTKSVVEAIFAVIVCDAIFSVAFTTLGM